MRSLRRGWPWVGLVGIVFLYRWSIHPVLFINYDHQPIRSAPPLAHPGIDPEQALARPPRPRRSANDRLPFDALLALLEPVLRRRLPALLHAHSVPPSRLSCSPAQAALSRYRAHFLRQAPPSGHLYPSAAHRLLVAVNLHSSQPVLAPLFNAILELLPFLGVENVMVSIYENGSWDHTKDGLLSFAQTLSALGVRHRFRTVEQDTDWAPVDRITQLATFRNHALQGLVAAEEDSEDPFSISDVVFVNDVFLCYTDILELIYQRSFQGASASCGTDWRPADSFLLRHHLPHPPTTAVFYDSWVARSITGKTLRPRLDLLTEWRDGFRVIFEHESGSVGEILRDRFRNGLPVPVYSCWNGLIVLDAKPFLKPYSLRFRSALRHKIPYRDRTETESGDQTECRASECQLLAKDFWSIGFNKWIIVPSVAVSYDENLYHSQALLKGSHRLSVGALNESDEKIVWSDYPKPSQVVCWPDMSTVHLDFEWNAVLENPYNRSLARLHLGPTFEHFLNLPFSS